MRRRQFLATMLLAQSVNLRALGQAPDVYIPMIGEVPRELGMPRIETFRTGLVAAGGPSSARIEWNHASEPDHTTVLAQKLGDAGADLIIVFGDKNAQLAARSSGRTPIIFFVGDDPIRLGLIRQLARPDGRSTGITGHNAELEAKRLELFCEGLRKAHTIGYLYAREEERLKLLRSAADKAGVHLKMIKLAPQEREKVLTFDERLRATFEGVRGEIDALMIGTYGFFGSRAILLARLAMEMRLPTIAAYTAFARAGGVMSYGPDYRELIARMGYYAARLLQGTKVHELPVEQPRVFDFVLNLNTAATLGVSFPENFTAQASEVIE